VFPIPAEAAQAKQRYEKEKKLLKRLLSTVSMNKWYQPSNTWKQLNDTDASSLLPILNGLVHFKAPTMPMQ
jgi:hypothetical protein